MQAINHLSLATAFRFTVIALPAGSQDSGAAVEALLSLPKASE